MNDYLSIDSGGYLNRNSMVGRFSDKSRWCSTEKYAKCVKYAVFFLAIRNLPDIYDLLLTVSRSGREHKDRQGYSSDQTEKEGVGQ